jgi:rSAM/selenodomain-associated transferase 2
LIMSAVAVSVIVPTLNAADHIGACLAAVADAAEIIVVDGGSEDDTVAVVSRRGATCVSAPAGRGPQLMAGAALAAQDWLLFLHADTVLASGWSREVANFIADEANTERAAAFRFALDDAASAARWLEAGVHWRARTLGLPYGDQGLLIHRSLYHRVKGFRALPIMEDVDLVRRIGRARFTHFETHAVTSARRWRKEGWLFRSARNLSCLACYYVGVPPRHIKRLYGQ